VADPGPTWRAIGTGDFNDDGHDDILLQNNDGSVAIWRTNGSSLTGSAVVADPGPSWTALGTGDFTGDGHADILLQNVDGSIAIWETNGTSLSGSAVVANPGTSWTASEQAISTATAIPTSSSRTRMVKQQSGKRTEPT
jgi:hypothetical protein